MMKKISALFIMMVVGLFPGILFPGELSIKKIGEWGSGFYFDVFTRDHFAYCAAGERGLEIINISNPSMPKKVGNHDTADSANALYVDDHWAYVADWEGGLQIFPCEPCGTPSTSLY